MLNWKKSESSSFHKAHHYTTKLTEGIILKRLNDILIDNVNGNLLRMISSSGDFAVVLDLCHWVHVVFGGEVRFVDVNVIYYLFVQRV